MLGLWSRLECLLFRGVKVFCVRVQRGGLGGALILLPWKVNVY
jgi:hypothetical protein